MKLERATNAKRNIIFGLLNKIVVIALPFATRTIIIRVLGEQYLGLGSLFTSILQVLSLAELGFDSAMVYSMYKPIAENDNDTLCALLAFYRKVYFIIGLIILLIGISILPILKVLIKGDYPSSVNLYLLYIIYLINTVASYLLFAYKGSLFNAHQRVDVLNNINTVINVGMYIVQIIILIFFKNYYFYAIVMVIATIGVNIATAIAARHYFPSIICYGMIGKEKKEEINGKIKGLMLNKVCHVSRNAFDSVFVSMFLGLTQTAIYGNYYYIMNAVTLVLSIVSSAILGGVGNSIVVETVEKNYRDMLKINFLYMWISGLCTVCLLCLYQPFNIFFFGTKLTFDIKIVILFCAYFYVLKMGDIRSVYVHANGLWWENRYRSLVESLLNIALNYILGRFFGVIGIVSATLISLFLVNFIWGSGIIFKYYFKTISVKEYYLVHIFYMFTTIVICGICYWVCSLIKLSIVPLMVVRLLIIMVLSNLLYFLVYRNTSQYKVAIPWILGIINGKKKR